MTIERDCQGVLGRKRVLMNATIISAEGAQAARVSELTGIGARIVCDRPVVSGSDVIFKRGKTFAAARIIWCDESGAGLEFYKAMPAVELAA